MKNATLIIIQLFSIVFFANAQKDAICAVKYKNLKTFTVLGTHNYWFFKNKSVMVHEPRYNAIYMNGFPAVVNGVMTTQNDTVKYNKEFNEFITDLAEMDKQKPVNVESKQYKKATTKTTNFNYSDKNNYIITDRLAKMNNWEITDETEMFMGYNCQKATISYKQEKYTAWFTKQLPYKSGPDVFRGLPGLILKVSNPSGNKGFEAVVIQTPYEGVPPKFNKQGLTISRNEWVAVANENRKKTGGGYSISITRQVKNGDTSQPKATVTSISYN